MVYHRSGEESSKDGSKPKNVFRNDGSFLEMFKKMQNSASTSASDSSSPSNSSSDQSPTSSPSLPCVNKEPQTSSSTPVSESKSCEQTEKFTTENEGKATLSNKFPIFGKRRGGRALPTGQVKKVKIEKKTEVVEEPKDAWSQYLAEVKKYRETTCEEEGKTRPLVK